MKLVIAFCILCCSLFSQDKMYFATSADTEHFDWALNLIASIHRYNFSDLGEVSVYDLGLTREQIDEFEKLEKVKVYPVQRTNPQMFKKFQVNSDGKIARGWYSWKPVVIKQALELHSEVFYIDSGITLMGPSDLLFKHLRQNGYFFLDCGHTIGRMTTKPVIKKFELTRPNREKILDELGISAGFQGVTVSVMKDYILPLYKLAYNIFYFKDDGSAPRGFGWARHDQTLFSIQARLLGLTVSEGMTRGKITLMLDGEETTYNLKKFIKFSRADFDLEKSSKFLRYR